MKNLRAKKAKDNSLRVSFGKIDGCFDIAYSWNGVEKCDAKLLDHRMTSFWMGFNGYKDRQDSLIAELVKRGYDIRTLDFQIKKLDQDDEEGKAINKSFLSGLSQV